MPHLYGDVTHMWYIYIYIYIHIYIYICIYIFIYIYGSGVFMPHVHGDVTHMCRDLKKYIYLHYYTCIPQFYCDISHDSRFENKKKARLWQLYISCISSYLTCILRYAWTMTRIDISICIWRILYTLAAVYQSPKVLQHTATHCSTLQHTATHCNTCRHLHINCRK